MKYIKIILLSFIVVATMYNETKAQSNDSLAIQQANGLKQLLTLPDNQSATIQSIYLNMLNAISNVNALDLAPENRGTHLAQIYTDYRTSLKNILTNNQWNTYQAACTTTQQVFKKHMQQQNIKYSFLNNQ